jgi:hypothetical protein
MWEPLLWESKVPLPYLQGFYSARYPEWMNTSFTLVEPRTIAGGMSLFSSNQKKFGIRYVTIPYFRSLPSKEERTKCKYFLSSAPRLTKEHYFFKSSHASPSCPLREKCRGRWMRSIDADKRKQKCWQTNFSHCHFVHLAVHTFQWALLYH